MYRMCVEKTDLEGVTVRAMLLVLREIGQCPMT